MRRACVALAVITLTNGALGDTMADIDYADLDGGAKSVDESVAALLQSELAAFLSPDVRDTPTTPPVFASPPPSALDGKQTPSIETIDLETTLADFLAVPAAEPVASPPPPHALDEVNSSDGETLESVLLASLSSPPPPAPQPAAPPPPAPATTI